MGHIILTHTKRKILTIMQINLKKIKTDADFVIILHSSPFFIRYEIIDVALAANDEHR